MVKGDVVVNGCLFSRWMLGIGFCHAYLKLIKSDVGDEQPVCV